MSEKTGGGIKREWEFGLKPEQIPARVRIVCPEGWPGPFSVTNADTGEDVPIVEAVVVFHRDSCRGTFIYETGEVDREVEDIVTDTFVAEVCLGDVPFDRAASAAEAKALLQERYG